MPVSKNRRKKEKKKKKKAKKTNTASNSVLHQDINEDITLDLENQSFDNTLQDEENKDSSNLTFSSSSASVKKHRERLKKLGFRQISIYLAPDIYEKLKYLKLHTNKSYADLISYWVEKEYNSFRKRRDIPIVPYDELLKG